MRAVGHFQERADVALDPARAAQRDILLLYAVDEMSAARVVAAPKPSEADVLLADILSVVVLVVWAPLQHRTLRQMEIHARS